MIYQNRKSMLEGERNWHGRNSKQLKENISNVQFKKIL